MTAILEKEPVRYFIVGGVCAVLNNLILIAGDAIGLHYAVCVFLTFLLIVPISYLAQALWSFTVPTSLSGFTHYVAGSLSGLFVAGVTVALLRDGFALPMIVTAPLATLFLALYNYWMTRWAVHQGQAA